METVLRLWDANFSACAPIGSQLRVAFPERWVRFHYLPGSKRYADSEAEIATALLRYGAVLDDLNNRDTQSFWSQPDIRIRTGRLAHIRFLPKSTTLPFRGEPCKWEMQDRNQLSGISMPALTPGNQCT